MSDLEQTVETALASAKETVEVDTKKVLADAQAKFDAAKAAAHAALIDLASATKADAEKVKQDAVTLKADAKAAKAAFLAKFGFIKRTVYRIFYVVLKDFSKL